MEIVDGEVRPSRLIAEALVLGKNSDEVIQQAEKMGLSEDLTKTVVSVCCRDKSASEQRELIEVGQ